MSDPQLAPAQNAKPRNFELRMSALYFALYLPLGIHLPYLPLWLEMKGFDATQIGVILSAPMFLRVATTPLFTAFADRMPDRAHVLVAAAVLALVISFGYFLAPTYALVLGVSLALAVFWTPQSPLADSLALSGVRRFGSVYPRMRIWGSISFLIANLVGGVLLSIASPAIVPALISAGLFACLVAALAAPRLGRPRQASPLSAAVMPGVSQRLFSRHFVLCVTAAGIVNGSHGFLFGFGSIYWQSIGIGETVVGLLWMFAVVAETGMFLAFERLFGRRPATLVLGVAAASAMLRWALLPLVWPAGAGVAGFFALQAFHALSTALVLIGVQKLIAESVPDSRTGAAQGIAFLANGTAMAAVTLASGPLYQAFGIGGSFAMVAVAGLGLALVLLAGAQPQRLVSGGETSEPR